LGFGKVFCKLSKSLFLGRKNCWKKEKEIYFYFSLLFVKKYYFLEERIVGKKKKKYIFIFSTFCKKILFLGRKNC
jgi:hypothetical protein